MAEIPPADEIRHLDTRHLGRRVWVYHRLDSTNTRALALSHDPAHDGLVLLAQEQCAGRGQYGRTWQAPPGSSVLMSILLFPPPALRRPVMLTSWAAVAVSETIRGLTGHEATIKWPNDVFLAGKKVCGVLIEQCNSGDATHPLATVVGIGLNVTQPLALFQQAGLTLAGSLVSQTGRTFATADVAEALLRQLDADYDRLQQGDFTLLETTWQRCLGLSGRQVRIEGLQQHYHGRLRALTLAGVELETEAGRVLSLAPEEIRHITLSEEPGTPQRD